MSKTEFELTDSVTYVKGVGPRRAKELEKLNIFTKYDLLTHYPRTYEDQRYITPIARATVDEQGIFVGTLSNIDLRETSRLKIITAILTDETASIQVIWFNQQYLMKLLHSGTRIMIIGKVKFDSWSGVLSINQINSFSILEPGEKVTLGIKPVYPATAALNQSFFRTAIQNLLDAMPPVKEILPAPIIKKLNLMPLDIAIRQIHFPANAEILKQARRRLAFDELFLIQCGLMLIKRQNTVEQLGISCKKNGELVQKVFESLPFKLTGDQLKTFETVAQDMENPQPMRRLIQGDVGSGKTVVAMLALVKAVENGYQGAFMAPTEILAAQHFNTFTKMLENFGIRIGLLSAKVTTSKKSRAEIYNKIANHEFDIVIGTHALIQDEVKFKNLGLVITDEQHRFGVTQRAKLGRKAEVVPDMIVMTATPIPRTMTLTVYGDLEVSLIKQMPPGRKPIKTSVKTVRSRKKVYEFVREEILSGRQAYVVCPLIERSEYESLHYIDPATEIFAMLSNGIFKDIPCALIHGKIKPAEKDEIMSRFHGGEIKLLVSTTVIEVGVDVPNATVMVIENAERFGLSQLHQLRGRVGRGSEKSYCILISNSKEGAAKARLDLMESTSNGFELAEEDLKIRGPGQFFGEAQHGLPDLKVANIFRDVETLLEARDAAENFVTSENDLNYFASLRKNLALAYGEKFSQINQA
ncbi:MAG: ATP-dependent DNA helicase RecG [Selenomonadaceae bacterium]|nr:ATP-dependent DNA helicase RecG [Selenomonadaceae bacterium]